MKKLLALLVLAGTSIAFGQFSVGIRIGTPPAPRVLRVRPANPGPGYVWVDGYWYPSTRNRYVWHNGYYTRPPYQGAIWISPRYESQQYYQGYWQADSRQSQHDHRWDSDRRNRDYNRSDNNNGDRR